MHFIRDLACALAFAVPASTLAPLYEDFGSGTTVIPGKFIVKLKDATSTAAANEVKSLIVAVDHVFNVTSFKAFAGSMDSAALEAVQAHPDVDYIEREVLLPASRYVSQHGAPWGLGRISHKGSQNFTDGTTYVYHDSAGEGVCVYVLDTGIFVDHDEFEGRAESLFPDQDFNDTSGHGTHVASTIGGTTYGVAKKARLYSVKVMGYERAMLGQQKLEANTFDISMGMEFVLKDSKTRHCPNGKVANLSVGMMAPLQSMNDLAKALINAGVFVAVAAGNAKRDSSLESPGSEPSICTVGATDKDNQMAEFSNHGPLVDILAPGVDVLSAAIDNKTASRRASGTSMAAPHVAGLAACILASEHRDPKTLCEYMARTASPWITMDRNDTVNLVAFNGNPKG